MGEDWNSIHQHSSAKLWEKIGIVSTNTALQNYGRRLEEYLPTQLCKTMGELMNT